MKVLFDDHLPKVGGRRIDCSFSEMERKFRVCLMREQRKLNPDTMLIDVLCDGVRLVREHIDFAREHGYVSAIPTTTSQRGQPTRKGVSYEQTLPAPTDQGGNKPEKEGEMVSNRKDITDLNQCSNGTELFVVPAEKRYMDYKLDVDLISRIVEQLNFREIICMHGGLTSKLREKGFFTANDFERIDDLVTQAGLRWITKESTPRPSSKL